MNPTALMPGDLVPAGPYSGQRVAARGIRGGERYYMLVDEHGVVSLLPPESVEAGELVKGE